MSLILYELGGRNGLRYSQFSWRTRLALAHKGLTAELKPVAVHDKEAIAFSRQGRVPILVDADEVVVDSWTIAEHLETQRPNQPSLFGGEIGHGLSRFVNAYTDRVLIPAVVPLLMIDVTRCVEPRDAEHLRLQIEAGFRRPLEVLAADRDQAILGVRKLFDPARVCLKAQPYLAGDHAAYADYVLFSLFQWARLVSTFPLIEDVDPLAAWRERMLDLHDGLARREASCAEREALS
ncbi:glutathione S-transferase N-terminal domain-containing protein [Phenylobacterium sp.]|uniref:glutathione S-transferase N-terminal domain-containing protein n=1 Tax=Phenylobacterium sp. TaxID=1871053 RepID=UPI002FC5AFCE